MKAPRIVEVAVSAVLLAMLSACASQVAKPEAAAPAAAPAASGAESGGMQRQGVSGNALGAAQDALDKRSVYYNFDSYALKPEFKPVVEANAGYLKRHAGASVRIEGNCDERGSSEYNIALGQRRADSIKEMLELAGVSDAQIETVSYGKEKPRAAGHDEQSWSQNRRSDFDYIRQ
jgi:peptidoglycan-associated lipoprotein